MLPCTVHMCALFLLRWYLMENFECSDFLVIASVCLNRRECFSVIDWEWRRSHETKPHKFSQYEPATVSL